MSLLLEMPRFSELPGFWADRADIQDSRPRRLRKSRCRSRGKRHGGKRDRGRHRRSNVRWCSYGRRCPGSENCWSYCRGWSKSFCAGLSRSELSEPPVSRVRGRRKSRSCTIFGCRCRHFPRISFDEKRAGGAGNNRSFGGRVFWIPVYRTISRYAH